MTKQEARMLARILVCLDGSARAPLVLTEAQTLCQKFGSSLIALRVLTIPPEFPPAASLQHGDPLPMHLTGIAMQELSALTRAVPESIPVQPMVRSGQPWRVIIEVAEDLDVDLVVIGSHGYGSWDRLLGTTAGKVVNLAHRNVLVVHERLKGFAH
jgi:universal stress protein F